MGILDTGYKSATSESYGSYDMMTIDVLFFSRPFPTSLEVSNNGGWGMSGTRTWALSTSRKPTLSVQRC